MTADTTYASVRPGEVRGVFRFHHSMTGLSAEDVRLGVLKSAITTEGACRNKQEGHYQEDKEGAARARIVQIEYDSVVPALLHVRSHHLPGGCLSCEFCTDFARHFEALGVVS